MTTGLATRPLGHLAIKRARVQQNPKGTVARLPEYLELEEVEAGLAVAVPDAETLRPSSRSGSKWSPHAWENPVRAS